MKHSPLSSYITGFVISLVLTLAAYSIVVSHILTGWIVITLILSLAILQLTVQAAFFLHVGQETKSRLKLIFFLSTLSMVLVIVVGSIWIMTHLNYNMMSSPSAVNSYVQSQDGF